MSNGTVSVKRITREQYDILKELGCEVATCYTTYDSMPLPKWYWELVCKNDTEAYQGSTYIYSHYTRVDSE